MNNIKMFIPIIGFWFVLTAEHQTSLVAVASAYQRLVFFAVGLAIGLSL